MTDKRIGSYSQMYAVGHKEIENIFDDDVIIEEKIDGSQFSFMKLDGELYCRSKGAQIVVDAPEKMFSRAIETVKEIQHLLTDGWVYRCEYLQKPKHNTLAYERIPKKYLILFDVMVGIEDYMSREEKESTANWLRIDVVPVVFSGRVENIEMLKELLDRESFLGGCKIEGVVVKNYKLFTRSKKIAIGKYVSEKFKEIHGKEWKKSNPKTVDILSDLITIYRHENRWEKAVQHLRDAGTLENSPRDIGMLIREIPTDVLKECEDEIKDELFKHFWPKIKRGIIGGFPEWYKDKLVENAFDEE